MECKGGLRIWVFYNSRRPTSPALVSGRECTIYCIYNPRRPTHPQVAGGYEVPASIYLQLPRRPPAYTGMTHPSTGMLDGMEVPRFYWLTHRRPTPPIGAWSGMRCSFIYYNQCRPTQRLVWSGAEVSFIYLHNPSPSDPTPPMVYEGPFISFHNPSE
ncbi:hypothetical protein AVEN_140130-1 [Araneus ventricosus]|uniref:Uncharacterized protein n=1 Tax=Araneus ventricosus TaxID=182803 RepID=A0A4Y2S631_ARAVE|nr:hypothetical protein AVEN_140130-1 [Araneus ventricosus]